MLYCTSVSTRVAMWDFPFQLRITKDINELELPKTCKTEFPDPDDLLNFKLIIQPDEGFYRGGKFSFSFKIGQNYPHEPPKVKCMNKVCSFLFLGRVPSV